MNICKTKDGSIICDQNEVMARWNEHFDDLLNKNNIQKYAAAEDGNTRSIEGPIAEEMNPPRSKSWSKLLRSSKIIRHREQTE